MFRLMFCLSLPVIVALSILPGVTHAKDLTADGHQGSLQEQRACRPDVLRHCRRLMDESDSVMADCLRANARALSPACRDALRSAERH
jgi:hypothetical protein